MNQMVTISYEEQLKAKAKAVRQRLMGKGKVVNILTEVDLSEADGDIEYLPPTALMKMREPREHVNMWFLHQKAIRDAERDPNQVRKFIKLRCIAYGMTYERFQSEKRDQETSMTRRLIILETDAQFPGLKATYLGQLAHKNHTTILYMRGTVKKGFVSKWRKKMEARAE